LNPAVIGATASLLTIVVVSRLGRVSRTEALYRMRLHRSPAIDCDSSKIRTTLVASSCLVAYGCLMPPLLLKYYVLPYQTGAGRLLADGSIDLLTGEAILALCSAALYIPLGLVSGYVIWRRYTPGAGHRIRELQKIEAAD
jgi:hypothetical protein